MAERIASVRPNQLRLRPPRRKPQLRAAIVVRWKCPKCKTLHLDRTERDDDALQPRPGARRRAPYTYAETTDCCGEGWCFAVTPLPADVADELVRGSCAP